MGVQTLEGFLDPANRLAKNKADALVLTCIEVAIALHGIHTVFILDHRDCGAYREFEALPEAPHPKSRKYPKSLDLESTIHKHYMDRLGALIMKSHRSLRVVTDLLDVPKSL